MPKANISLSAFNRGIVSRYALGRIDIERMRLSAEEQTNWIPRVLGPMSLRPGLGYLGTTRSNIATQPVPFVYASDDTAILELGGGVLRVKVSDALVTRQTDGSTVQSGDFSAATGWTLVASAGASALVTAGGLNLSGVARGGIATCTQQITLTNSGRPRALRIVVDRGPITFRVGSTSGDDNYFPTSGLGTGTHSLVISPTTNWFIQFECTALTTKIVDSCTIEAAGTLELPIPWVAGDLSLVRWTQSADVVYLACYGYQQRKIERRQNNSWSIVLYQPDNGPFGAVPTSDVSLTPSGTHGNITLAASRAFFKSTNVGSLFRLTQTSQDQTLNIAAQNTFTDTVRITGVGRARAFTLQIAGTWVGTITLQRSFDGEDSGFTNVETYTANTTKTITDDFDNSIVWYRAGFETANYTSGTAIIQLKFPGGGGSGIVRVTGFTSSTSVSAEVVGLLKSLTATTDWLEGQWSTRRGWPTVTQLFDGRLWWAGNDRVWGSVSDGYESFTNDLTGDSAPISRSIGYGPIAKINWFLALDVAFLGSDTSEIAMRGSKLNEPVTPTAFGLKDISTQGSMRTAAAKIDTFGVFISKSRHRVFIIEYVSDVQDYRTRDLTEMLPPEANDPEYTKVVIQRQPDTRIHCIRSDGTVRVCVFEPIEGVRAWWDIETDGVVEDAVVLPGVEEDQVYYYVRRTIGSATVRYVEKFAKMTECVGATLNKCADAFVTGTNSPASATISGLTHLAGKSVILWADGVDLGTHTVSGGAITASQAVTSYCVGLGYSATYKSSKLAYAAGGGTALTQKKRACRVGLILRDVHAQGIESGVDFVTMDNLPLVKDGAEIDTDDVFADYDEPMYTLPGSFDTDSRLCLRATAPRPVTVLAAVIDIQTNG